MHHVCALGMQTVIDGAIRSAIRSEIRSKIQNGIRSGIRRTDSFKEFDIMITI